MFDSRLDASPAKARAGDGYPEREERDQANRPTASTRGESSMAEFLYEFVDAAGRLEQGIVRARTFEDARESLDREGVSHNKWKSMEQYL
jgi:hypothetical protein